ncbi:MFS transporter [bacterium]|jgi:glycoside/pentoside/hexuronide:cation symporter, GPH family|nr:MFS transporter [Gammaproteobacteria bacterium]MDB3937075.1 MFS transporter [bacterium]
MSRHRATDQSVSWRTIIAYGAPAAGAGYMYLLLSLYMMKFATDILLIAPAVMGVIYSLSRIWDAISDPLVGYLSDRTTTRLGRRRTWILASCVPISASFYMVFAPPMSLTGDALVVWVAVAVIGFYSAMTLFFVPHLSLGAELSDNYHERSRMFGVRHAAYIIGSIFSLVSLYFLLEAGERVREVAEQLALLAVGVMFLLVIFSVVQLRERREFQGRMNAGPIKAFRDVWENPHARLLLVVTFIEFVGSSAIAVLTLYVTEYVVGAPAWAPLIILAYMLPSSASVPLWLPLSRRFGKIRVWMGGMILTGVSFGAMFFLPFFADTTTRLIWIIVMAFFAGLANGCGGTIGPSVQGDVIDYDENLTGERKEGSYFAAWNFVQKSALGLMLLLTGFVLQWSGFIPNVPQSMTVQLSMVTLYSLFPLVCYGIGAFLFSRFKLDEKAYAEIRASLDAKKVR